MFSLEKLFGKDDRFFGLLEASAEEARHSVQALTQLLQSPASTPSLADVHQAEKADKLILEILRDLYSGKYEATKVLAMKDLHELPEKVIDRCRGAGNVLSHVMLKNS